MSPRTTRAKRQRHRHTQRSGQLHSMPSMRVRVFGVQLAQAVTEISHRA
jgi:hypothetical protein